MKEGGPLPEVKEGSPLPEVKEGGPLKVDVEQPAQIYMPPPTFHPCPTTDKCKSFVCVSCEHACTVN